MPDLIIRVMPSKFTIMHSIIGWPLILGILFVLIQKFEKISKVPNNSAHILIVLIILFYSASHYKVFIKLQNLFIENTTIQSASIEDKNFWDIVKNSEFDGYIVTSYSTSTISMRKALRPIILDVSALDFVPYVPNTAKSMSMIIEKIYGISFSNPPLEVRNQAFLSDDAIKLNFEKYSREKWQLLSKNFNLSAIIVPVNWEIDLTPLAKSNSFAFYML